MKKKILWAAILVSGLLITRPVPVFSQSWSLTGNAGTNPPTNFLGTTDNKALIFKTNNVSRVTLTSSTYGGLDVGASTIPSYINIFGKDVVGTVIPFHISGNIQGTSWGNSNGNTMGRLIRLNQGPSEANGGVNWYDIGIGQDTCFFITNHNVPPSSGNGVIRKRMIVISPEDRVGINLAGDNIGNGAVPTANFHTNGTVRLQNLSSGTGNILVIDNDGNVYRSSSTARIGAASEEKELLEAEIDKLKKDVDDLKSLVKELQAITTNMKEGSLEISTNSKGKLFQNAPNPYSGSTTIKYILPEHSQNAFLDILDVNGAMVKRFNLSGGGTKSVEIASGELSAGTYLYCLVVDGKKVDTKKMILTR